MKSFKLIPLFFLTFVLSGNIQVAKGQTPYQDSLRVIELIKTANRNTEIGNALFKEAELLIKGTHLKLIHTNQYALFLSNTGKTDSAILVMEASLDTLSIEGQSDPTIVEYAKSYLIKSQFFVVKGAYQKAIDARSDGYNVLENHDIEDEVTVSALIGFGIDYWRINNYTESTKWLERAIRLAEKLDIQSELRRAYIMKGLDHYSLNQLILAKEYYQRVFDMIGDDIESNARDYMATCNNMGLTYQTEKQYDSAMRYYEEGLALIESDKIEKGYTYLIPYYSATFTQNIGYTALWRQQYGKAIEFYKKAEQIGIANYGENHPFLISIYKGLAEAHESIDELSMAENYFKRELEITKQNDLNEALAYNDLGNFYLNRKKDLQKATQYYDSAILVNTSVFLGEKEVFSVPDEYLSSLQGQSALLLENGSFSKRDADVLLEKAKNMIFQVGKNSDGTALQGSVPQILQSLYVAYDKKDSVSTKRSPELLELKWEISQLSRAALLRSQLQDRYSLNYSLPKDILESEQELKDSINARISELKPGVIDSGLFVLNRRYEEFIGRLEEEYPNYAALKNKTDFSTLPEEKSVLKRGEAILHFFEGQENLFILTITKNDVRSWSVNKEEIGGLIEAFNQSIFNGNMEELILNSRKLKQAFKMEPENLANVSHLTIMPAGEIWKLDFAAILANEEERFLTEEMTFSYRILNKMGGGELNRSSDVLAFSYNDIVDSLEIKEAVRFREIDDELPGTSKEVTAISKLFDGKYYYADMANETAFKSEGKKFGILHLAVHGVQNDIFPQNSFLKFHSGDSLNDGKLYAYELYNLNFNAQLAVLSACNSGSGKVDSGEGMMSLGRAFAYAGVQSILASRWKVPDHTAPVIMKHFYEGLKSGKRKSEALQYAQKMYLTEASNVEKAPYFWAGYYIIGNDDPVVSSSFLVSKMGMFLISLSVILVIGTLVIVQRKQAK